VTDLERLGGQSVLRAVVDDFVDRCFDDPMIGFLFQRASRDRIKRFEREHAASHLGGTERYTGRPLRDAHAAHRILEGHFNRRRQLLRETLDDHGVPPEVRDAWLAFQEALRDEISGGPC
jgi:hemoglobin